jgi:hypothetical protein
MRARADLFRNTLEIDDGDRPPNPLAQFGKWARQGGNLVGHYASKLVGGPGAYAGLWALLTETYGAVISGSPPPVSPRQVMEIERLVSDLVDHDRARVADGQRP